MIYDSLLVASSIIKISFQLKINLHIPVLGILTSLLYFFNFKNEGINIYYYQKKKSFN